MTAQFIDRRQLKIDTRERLRSAQVSPLVMTALYLGILLVLDVADTISSNGAASVPERPLPGIFIYALAALLSVVLGAGFTLYCMAVRRGERAEFQTLFDGFSLAGKVVGLYLLTNLFILLWAMLFILPGIIASYRYRFAMYNLLENPDLGILEALRLSKIQTWGYKGQLFFLDVSYLGWILLSAAPSLLLLVLVWSALLPAGTAAAAVPAWAQVLLSVDPTLLTAVLGLWSLAVGVFYLCNYQCVDLGYFEAAKETSGVSPVRPGGEDGGVSPW